MKKYVCLLLSILMLMTMFVSPAAAAAPASAEPVGFSINRVESADTSALPDILTLQTEAIQPAYRIASAEGLLRLSELVEQEHTLEGITFYLVCDVDMTGLDWLPIGADTPTGNSNPPKYFAGTLDGQGHVIRNLVYENRTGGNMVAVTGLFGITKGATVKNLILDESCSFTYSGTANDNRTGAIIGWANGSNTIDNCLSLAAVNGKNHTGGIVGQYPGSASTLLRIVNTTNAGPVTGAGAAGGIGGYMQGPLEIVNCRNAGDVSTASTAVGDVYQAVGGIVARDIRVAGQKNLVDGCVNNGTLTGGLTGGIIGAVQLASGETSVQNCTTYGKTESSPADAVSGQIIGKNAANNGSWPHLTGNQEKAGQSDRTLLSAMLQVCAQVTAGTTDQSESTSLRLVTSVNAELDAWQEIGFVFVLQPAGGEATDEIRRGSTTVYRSIAGTDGEALVNYRPQVMFAPTSAYFAAYSITDIDRSYFDMQITVRAFAVTQEGETVYGESATFAVSDLF